MDDFMLFCGEGQDGGERNHIYRFPGISEMNNRVKCPT